MLRLSKILAISLSVVGSLVYAGVVIAASPAPTPRATCIPRPACLDVRPRCLLVEPPGGWCSPSPKPSVTSKPTPRPTQDSSLAGKLKSCQAKESAVKTRSQNLVKITKNMLEKFDAISKRVKDYYTTKLLAKGKTVANYNTLTTDIQNKKNSVQTALNKAQSDSSSFNCTSKEPRKLLTQFNDDMKAVKLALKDYRVAVRNLIVAVRSVRGVEHRVTPSARPNQATGSGNSQGGGR